MAGGGKDRPPPVNATTAAGYAPPGGRHQDPKPVTPSVQGDRSDQRLPFVDVHLVPTPAVMPTVPEVEHQQNVTHNLNKHHVLKRGCGSEFWTPVGAASECTYAPYYVVRSSMGSVFPLFLHTLPLIR